MKEESLSQSCFPRSTSHCTVNWSHFKYFVHLTGLHLKNCVSFSSSVKLLLSWTWYNTHTWKGNRTNYVVVPILSEIIHSFPYFPSSQLRWMESINLPMPTPAGLTTFEGPPHMLGNNLFKKGTKVCLHYTIAYGYHTVFCNSEHCVILIEWVFCAIPSTLYC